jgi:tetratricopeptide (TPR) repeat protein
MSRRRNFAEDARPLEVEIEGQLFVAMPCQFGGGGIGWLLERHIDVHEFGQDLRPYLSLYVNVRGSRYWDRDDSAKMQQAAQYRGTQTRCAMDFTRSHFLNAARDLRIRIGDQYAQLQKREYQRSRNVGWEALHEYDCSLGSDDIKCRVRAQLWLVRSCELVWGEEQTEVIINDFDRSIQDFTEALDLEPDDSIALHNRAFAFFKKGDRKAALGDLDRLIQLDGITASSYYLRACVRYEEGDLDGTIADCTQVLELNSGRDDALRLRGRAYLDRALRLID